MAPPAAAAAIEKAKTNMRCIHISSRAVKKRPTCASIRARRHREQAPAPDSA
jgi:hypothetical protein